MEMPSLKDFELLILSIYYRLKHDPRAMDRRGECTVEVDPGSGMPLSANDLVSRSRAVRGEKLAYGYKLHPKSLAKSFMALDYKKPELWTEEECILVSRVEVMIKKCVREMTSKGWFIERYASEWDGTPMALGEDGFCTQAMLTSSGMNEAERITPRTKYERGGVSILNDAPIEVINAAPEHVKALWREENRAPVAAASGL